MTFSITNECNVQIRTNLELKKDENGWTSWALRALKGISPCGQTHASSQRESGGNERRLGQLNDETGAVLLQRCSGCSGNLQFLDVIRDLDNTCGGKQKQNTGWDLDQSLGMRHPCIQQQKKKKRRPKTENNLEFTTRTPIYKIINSNKTKGIIEGSNTTCEVKILIGLRNS